MNKYVLSADDEMNSGGSANHFCEIWTCFQGNEAYDNARMGGSVSSFVYVLTNSCWGDCVKIGLSDDIKNIQVNSSDLPKDSEILVILSTSKGDEVLALIRDVVDMQFSGNRKIGKGFISCQPQKIQKILRDIECLLDDAKIIDPKSDKDEQGFAPRFKFSMISLAPGDEIVFDPTGEVVVIASDDTVKKRGERKSYKLSQFVRKFIPKESRVPSGAYRGSRYFSYEGKTLQEMREEQEHCS